MWIPAVKVDFIYSVESLGGGGADFDQVSVQGSLKRVGFKGQCEFVWDFYFSIPNSQVGLGFYIEENTMLGTNQWKKKETPLWTGHSFYSLGACSNITGCNSLLFCQKPNCRAVHHSYANKNIFIVPLNQSQFLQEWHFSLSRPIISCPWN